MYYFQIGFKELNLVDYYSTHFKGIFMEVELLQA